MRRIIARVAVTTLVVTLGAVGAAAPAALAADLDETRDAVWDVVWEADASNQLVISAFVNAGLAARNRNELVAARNQADAALDSVWYSSLAQLDDLLALFPVELADDVASATSQLLRDHDAAHDEVTEYFDDMYDALVPPGQTTTSTTIPPTTSTTSAASTTTTTSAATTTSTSTTSTTTTLPTTSTTTGASTTTTTSGATTTTTRPQTVGGTAAPSEPTDPTRGAAETIDSMDVLIGVGDTAYALPVAGGSPSSQGEASASTGSGTDGAASVGSGAAPVSRMMVEIGETIQVPDRVIQFTVAPIVFVEVLLGILFESLASLVVPVAVLITAVAVFVWKERRRPFDVGLAQPPM